MIYKFNSELKNQIKGNGEILELTIVGKTVGMSITRDNKSIPILLDKEQLFDLIGALHTIKAKLEKDGRG